MSETTAERAAKLAAPGTHLRSVDCRGCGAAGAALAAPGQEEGARCSACWASSPGAGLVVPHHAEAVSMVLIPHVEPVDTVLHPAPEFVCPARADGQCCTPTPAPVTVLRGAALAYGWRVVTQHSRGSVVGGDGKSLAVAEIWSVRFRRDGWQGYAVRRGDKWDSVCVFGAELLPFLALGVADLREWLVTPDCGAEWYAEIRKRRAAQKLAAKIVKCPGPGKCEPELAGQLFTLLGVPFERAEHTHRANGDIKIKNSRAGAEHGG